ncbi:MAG: hypothetical protein ACMUIA_06585 [bacterium]
MKSMGKNRKTVELSLWTMAMLAVFFSLPSLVGKSNAVSTGNLLNPLICQFCARDMLTQYWMHMYRMPSTLSSQMVIFTTMNRELLAKAEPDECFKGIGESYPYDKSCPPDSGCIPKVNQSYVWGLTKSGNNLWFGTVSNVNCLIEGAGMGLTTPYQTSSWICEFGNSCLCDSNLPAPLPAIVGDWRPPQIFLL